VFRWVQIDAKFESATADQPLRLVGVIADVTERKKLEHEATKLSERLIDLQERERQRIAQELHDSTAQHLVAVDLNLSCLRPREGLNYEEIKRWDQTEASLQEAIKEIRTFSYLMHPPALQTAGLCATIDEYVAGFGSRSKLDVRVRLNPDIDRLAFELQRSLLRIAQEALANVHHHANASTVGLAIRMVAGCVHLIVRDNGQGHKGNNRLTFGCGRGVTGMQARAQQHGGTLRLRTGSGGTSVHVAVPAGPLHQAMRPI
jgi:signal transduction histidine kinase